jgi:hypothetical protein
MKKGSSIDADIKKRAERYGILEKKTANIDKRRKKAAGIILKRKAKKGTLKLLGKPRYQKHGSAMSMGDFWKKLK